MAQHMVLFTPLERKVDVEAGATLLEAAGKAKITIDSICGGDGICGRCKMIVRKGKVGGRVTALLTREEIREGVVLACQTTVQSDLVVEIPDETRAREKVVIDRDAQRFRAVHSGVKKRQFVSSPIVIKVALRIAPQDVLEFVPQNEPEVVDTVHSQCQCNNRDLLW